jgi:hypothetical protein
MNLIGKEDCRICNVIGNQCFGYERRGWEYEKDPLPAEALELIAVDDVVKVDDEKNLKMVSYQKKKCPICGNMYQYRTEMVYFIHFIDFCEFLDRI